jgi:hypothetical protein
MLSCEPKFTSARMCSTAPLLIFWRSEPMECIVSSRRSGQNRATSNREVVAEASGRGPLFHDNGPGTPQKSQLRHPTPEHRTAMSLGNVIYMDERISRNQPTRPGLRDRRYAIRFPFAADTELIDMESGSRAVGVTSDISLGGCFVCTSKPFPVATRVRISLTRKSQRIEALAVVRILKPRIGMGIEFIDVEGAYQETLSRWIEQIRQSR